MFVRVVTEISLNSGISSESTRRTPRSGQVESVRRIIYHLGDTILQARTGYGKSIVFQAVSIILPHKITTQIVPFSKLGEEQYRTIATYSGTRPIWVDQSTSKEALRQGRYTHILLGPEQAIHYRFLRLFRTAEFNQRIAFVGIDELHTIHQWRDFRSSFANLHQVRAALPVMIPWFGCTATLTPDAELFIHQVGAFREEGHQVGSLEIIRTTIDRRDISIIVQCLPKGSLRDFRRLEFLLNKGPNDQITKTIVYIDSKAKIISARHHLLKRVSPADSTCRIILATVSLGMGMDIPDVMQVVQYGPVRSGDIADLWQRFGRAVRAGGSLHGKAYFFAPYWFFDRLGEEDPVKSNPRAAPLSHQPPVPSRLRQAITNGDDESDSDNCSVASSTYSQLAFMPQDLYDLTPGVAADQPPTSTAYQVHPTLGLFGDHIVRQRWTAQEKKWRENLAVNNQLMYEFANASCFRTAALSMLQEAAMSSSRVAGYMCCNACSPSLGALDGMPPKHQTLRKPYMNSKAWFIWQELHSYADRIAATELWPEKERFCHLPSTVFLESRLQSALAKELATTGYVPSGVEDLQTRVPDLATWEHLEEWGDRLVAECIRLQPIAVSKWTDHKQRAATQRAHTRRAATGVTPTTPQASPFTPNTSFSSDATLVGELTYPVTPTPARGDAPIPPSTTRRQPTKRQRRINSVGTGAQNKRR
ncbi:P-loop containing nucleoside triphosphate hydrolase protein [Chaetomium strumarium]|uniref:DNA 3'-5' helicase n=1 Tax=Chaetomium strumarium TaxID=1170767 RepID=A0AAJ0M6Z2_9PEZI|nr:P-loop containing nucleoside triphosphate hydrolase protein [Chaetomium strumarium]